MSANVSILATILTNNLSLRVARIVVVIIRLQLAEGLGNALHEEQDDRCR